MVPSVEKRSGCKFRTEATMSAIRVARGLHRAGLSLSKWKVTIMDMEKISFLIAAGIWLQWTMGNPDSPGVTTGTAKDNPSSSLQ